MSIRERAQSAFPRLSQRGSRWSRVGAVLASLGLAATLLTAFSAPANAVTGSDFVPGEIISDVVMYDTSTMSVAGIQSFLDSKGGTCKTGYTCLATFTQTTSNYKVPTTGGYTQGVCAPYVGAKDETAATIIYKVAQYCGVNPQSILVTLQKEESLVTSTDPTSLTYRKAMGYGCPDTASCSANFYGFFKQVYWGARAMARPVSAYKPGVKSAILYNSNRACGTKSVTVVNKATSNLYTYTPYTPDRAALDNLHGTGDSCSSYGNRNFWYYFSTWFGSTVLPQTDISFVQASYQDLLGVAATTAQQESGARSLSKGMARSTFALDLIEGSTYRAALITSDYTAILGTTPTAAKVTEYLGKISKGTVKQNDLTPYLMSFSSYYAKVGGTPSTFATAVYQYLLERAPSPGELAAAVKSLKTESRESFVRSIWSSAEFDTDTAKADYQTYLQRPPTTTELATLVAFLKTSSKAQAIAKVLNKQDYLNSALIRFPISTD